MNETLSSMAELNARIAAIGNPTTSEIIDTLDTHSGDAWGTVYSIGETFYVVLGKDTAKLSW